MKNPAQLNNLFDLTGAAVKDCLQIRQAYLSDDPHDFQMPDPFDIPAVDQKSVYLSEIIHLSVLVISVDTHLL